MNPPLVMNGVTVPGPEIKHPADGQVYWFITDLGRAKKHLWGSFCWDFDRFNHGIWLEANDISLVCKAIQKPIKEYLTQHQVG